MSTNQEINFGSDSVAHSYDKHLVPIIFESWATRLLDMHHSWDGVHVLDVATGTGVVAQQLATRVGSEGKVYAMDLNAQMLAIAKKKCEHASVDMSFIESSVESIPLPVNTVDVILCQQGFQFFQGKQKAAQEMYRVLNKDGKLFLTTWCPVSDCHFFGAICEALELLDEPEISRIMRIPFDLMPKAELPGYFEAAGFKDVRVFQQQSDLTIKGGIESVIKTAYATPIGPRLKGKSEEWQREFQMVFTDLVNNLGSNTDNMGQLVSNVLTAQK